MPRAPLMPRQRQAATSQRDAYSGATLSQHEAGLPQRDDGKVVMNMLAALDRSANLGLA